MKEYRKGRVQKMGFIHLIEDKNYFSFPFRYIERQVEVEYDSDTVEIYYQLERIATHNRNYRKGTYTKVKDHLSSSHKF